jgi:hypothetical protein
MVSQLLLIRLFQKTASLRGVDSGLAQHMVLYGIPAGARLFRVPAGLRRLMTCLNSSGPNFFSRKPSSYHGIRTKARPARQKIRAVPRLSSLGSETGGSGESLNQERADLGRLSRERRLDRMAA